MGPHPAVAAVRLAVRRSLAGAGAGPVLVACSGGADSLALLAAAVFETRHGGRPVVGVTVDHGLQEGSAERAARVAEQMTGLGATEVVTAHVHVGPSGRGPEAAARDARYAALREAADRRDAGVVLLGHTLDDQAETVLLGLVRGSGPRSVAGMRPASPPFLRPLLGVTRAQTEEACRAEGIEFWEDPHNVDPRFTRVRVRHRVMPVLERELGPGVAAALARTAAQLQEDVDALDGLADRALGAAVRDPALLEDTSALAGPVGRLLDVPTLQGLPTAVRRRVLRRAAVEAGCPPGELFRVHVEAVDELVGDYRGQVRVELPGHVRAVRAGDVLAFAGVGRPDHGEPVAG